MNKAGFLVGDELRYVGDEDWYEVGTIVYMILDDDDGTVMVNPDPDNHNVYANDSLWVGLSGLERVEDGDSND